MQRYEYKVIPAPRRGEKARGVKSTEDRFALALTMLMNEQGRDGWDYVRADALPCDERVGLTGTKTTFQNMLVFRRLLDTETMTVAETAPLALHTPLAAPVAAAAAPMPRVMGATEAPLGVAPQVGPARVAAE